MDTNVSASYLRRSERSGRQTYPSSFLLTVQIYFQLIAKSLILSGSYYIRFKVAIRFFLAHFERIFSCKFRCTFKKTAKTKKIHKFWTVNFISFFFKAKINFKDTPTLGKQSTINYELAKKKF